MAFQAARRRRENKIEKDGEPVVPEGLRLISPEELAEHNKEGDLWTALHGLVFDLTKWFRQHPGGNTVLKGIAGVNGSEAFGAIHGARGPLLMINDEFSENVTLIGKFDAPEEEEMISGTVSRDWISQSEKLMTYVIGGGAVDIEEEISLGKSEIVKETREGPTSILYISGTRAPSQYLKDPNMKQQASVALTSLRTKLQEAGGSLEDIVKLTIYIKDIDEDKIISVARAMQDTCQAWGKPHDFLKDNKTKRRRGARVGPAAYSMVGVTGLTEETAVVEFDAVAVIPAEVPASSKL